MLLVVLFKLLLLLKDKVMDQLQDKFMDQLQDKIMDELMDQLQGKAMDQLQDKAMDQLLLVRLLLLMNEMWADSWSVETIACPLLALDQLDRHLSPLSSFSA